MPVMATEARHLPDLSEPTEKTTPLPVKINIIDTGHSTTYVFESRPGSSLRFPRALIRVQRQLPVIWSLSTQAKTEEPAHSSTSTITDEQIIGTLTEGVKAVEVEDPALVEERRIAAVLDRYPALGRSPARTRNLFRQQPAQSWGEVFGRFLFGDIPVIDP